VSRQLRWISKSLALAVHDRLMGEHGGATGTRDDGALEAALSAPRNHASYANRDVFTLAAVYAHAVTRNHPFADGNKRVAFTLAAVFLQWNGFRLEAPEQEAVTMMQALSDRSIGFEDYALWLRNASKKIQPGKGSGR
jgi:death-on-curing protein